MPAGWDAHQRDVRQRRPRHQHHVVRGETTTCTFTNTQQGTITVDKVTDPAGSTQVFDFTASYDADGSC